MSERFQFHKGTIKTTSIKVAKGIEDNFNSIKVQLKLEHKYQFTAKYQFQFHKGTIKTRYKKFKIRGW